MTETIPQTPKQILSRVAAPQARRLKTAGWLSVLAALIWPAQAALVALVLGDLVSPGVSPPLSPLMGAAGFIVLALVRIVLDWMALKLSADAAEAILTEARKRLIGHAVRQATGAAALSPSQTASLMAEKLAALGPWATRYQPTFIRARIVPLAFIIIVMTQSWAAAAIFLLAGPLIPLFMALVGMAAQDASERQMVEIGALNKLLIDRIAAITDLRLLGAEGRSRADLEVKTEDLRSRTMAVLRVAFLSSTVLELFAAIGVAMVAVYVGFSLIGWMQFGTWGVQMTPATGIFLLMIAPEFFQPLRDLAAAWHDRAAALAVAGELDSAETEIAKASKMLGEGGTGQPLASATLRWSGLQIRPAQGAAPIEMPDGTIEPGEAVAITGASGAGKTTLLTTLAGLIVPEAGEITQEVGGYSTGVSLWYLHIDKEMGSGSHTGNIAITYAGTPTLKTVNVDYFTNVSSDQPIAKTNTTKNASAATISMAYTVAANSMTTDVMGHNVNRVITAQNAQTEIAEVRGMLK